MSNALAASTLRRWREDPVAFVRECLHAEPDAWQADMLRAFPKHNRLAAKACKGPGKTAVLAWMGWNFMLTRPHCKVPVTSVTGKNLDDGLWAEFAKWQRHAPVLQHCFEWTKTRIVAKEAPATWWVSHRTWSADADPTKQADTLAGLHEDYLLFLIDEVSEIPRGVVSAAEAALTGGVETKLVIMGNPTRTDGPLWDACVADRRLWHVTTITGDPDNPKRSPRINLEEAKKQVEKYGRDSYIVRVNILGEFPDRQADKLLGAEEVAEAAARFIAPATVEQEARIIGCDVARFGDDAAVFAPRQGRVLYPLRELRGLRTDELGDQLITAAERWDADRCFIDATGLGAGTYDHCVGRGYGHRVTEVNFGSRALEDDRFENRRAEMYWRMAEWVRAGGSLPNDPLLMAELLAPVYFFDRRGRICLEPKDDIKVRLGRSPDRSDGAALTFAGPVQSRQRKGIPPSVKGSTVNSTLGRSYNPLDF